MFAVAAPPPEPPEEPVPLHMTLPPPPTEEGPAPEARGGFRWRPPTRREPKPSPEPMPEPELGPEAEPVAFMAAEHESVTGIPTGPGEVVVLSAAATKKKQKRERKGERQLEPGDKPRSDGRRRSVTMLLVVALVLVAGGIAYFAVKKTNNNTTTSSPPTTSAVAADAALATSINLRLADLPPGWARVPPSTPAARPLAAPLQAQRTADTALAGCLGIPVSTASGLFGGVALPGESSTSVSPTFQDSSSTGFQMHSTTTAMTSAAQVQSLAAPFASASFVPCYSQHQAALVAAASPGSVAQLQVVTLPAPAGVKAYGYLTNITTASGGKEVVGQAFMFGGRVTSLLEPTTEGPPVPSSAFVPAYDAMVARIATASR